MRTRLGSLLLAVLLAAACSESGLEPATGPETIPPVAATHVVAPFTDFDLYLFDVKKGGITRLTSIPGAGEYNPSFSNNGKQVVHDVVTTDSHDLWITDLATGSSAPLAGGDGGNDADWSPMGDLIAFDRLPSGDLSIYVVPPTGGTRTLVRQGAVDPAWGPDGTRIVFHDLFNGGIRSIEVGTGTETVLSSFGGQPAVSRNGRKVAFTHEANIWIVDLDEAGSPIGAPVQLTFDAFPVFNQQPSWSKDDVWFASNRRGDDSDLWLVPSTGGGPIMIVGTDDTDEYDPAAYKEKVLVFSSAAGS